MSSKIEETKGIRVVFILEIIGRPAEHLIETLNKLIEEMDKEKGVKVVNKKIHEVIELKNQKDFFTTFAEVEMEIEEVLQVAIMMFKYMPANIEIIEPELIALANAGWSDVLNELTRRLHGYDEIARILQMENAKLQKQLKESSLNNQKNSGEAYGEKENEKVEDIEVKNLGKIGGENPEESSEEKNNEKKVKKNE